jgi:hypothetical protein
VAHGSRVQESRTCIVLPVKESNHDARTRINITKPMSKPSQSFSTRSRDAVLDEEKRHRRTNLGINPRKLPP